jgi:hypothetical protein
MLLIEVFVCNVYNQRYFGKLFLYLSSWNFHYFIALFLTLPTFIFYMCHMSKWKRLVILLISQLYAHPISQGLDLEWNLRGTLLFSFLLGKLSKMIRYVILINHLKNQDNVIGIPPLRMWKKVLNPRYKRTNLKILNISNCVGKRGKK